MRNLIKLFPFLFIVILVACDDKYEQLPPRERSINYELEAMYKGIEDAHTFTPFRKNIGILLGLAADELSYNQDFPNFYDNSIKPTDEEVATVWRDIYGSISISNEVRSHLYSNTDYIDATEYMKRVTVGETLFIRALGHFYAVNLFGEVPIADPKYTHTRQPVSVVYDHIITDLTHAEELLYKEYRTYGRQCANKYAASALLARVYLYTENYSMAEKYATSVIDQADMYQLIRYVLNPPNLEAIYIISSPLEFSTTTTYLSDSLNKSISNNDTRKQWFEGTPGRFFESRIPWLISGSILRLGEKYLIRAEARAKQGNIIGANEDINVIRRRAGLADTTIYTVPGILTEVLLQRQIELFGQWGHRWFDLKRLHLSDSILSWKQDWQPTDTLLPIPAFIVATNGWEQNPGY